MSNNESLDCYSEVHRRIRIHCIEVLLRHALTELVLMYNMGTERPLYKLIQEIKQCLNEKSMEEQDEVTGTPV